MKTKLYGLLNMLYGLLTSLYLLIINGTIRISRTNESAVLVNIFTVATYFFLIFGIVVIVLNSLVLKKADKFVRNCLMIGIGVAVCNVLAGLLIGGLTIFSFASIVVGLMLLIKKQDMI